MKKNNGTTETPASVICDGEQQVGACPVVSPLRQVTNPVGSTYCTRLFAVAAEMRDTAPICDPDWADQLTDWADRIELTAAPQPATGGAATWEEEIRRHDATPPAHGDGEGVKIDYITAFNFAKDNGLDYNRLCAAVREMVTTRPAPEAQEARDAWTPVSERLPDEGTECLVLVQYGTDPKFYVAIDTWRMQREAPVSFSSATIETGLMWDENDFLDVLMWQPIKRPSQSAIDAALALPAQGEGDNG